MNKLNNFKLSSYQILEFQKYGFLKLENFLDKKFVKKIKKNFFKVFKGKYNTGLQPDKIKWSKNDILVKSPRQLCNVWKSDFELKSLILNENIGRISAQLTGWNGIKICQDSLYWVPPKCGGVGMHQDNSYQDWHLPGKTITCWISLSDLSLNSSGIEYLVGSHKTKITKPIKIFFSGKKYKYTTKSKLLKNFKSEVITGKAGTVVFHHGNIWHGSNINLSNKSRFSISIHMIPSNSKFSNKFKHPQYSRYKFNNSLKMDESFFPTTYKA